jgi:phosphoserine phosphatase
MIGIAILDMDGTLLAKRTIDTFCESFGLQRELKKIDKMAITLPAYEITNKIAKLLAGKKKKDLMNIFNTIPLSPGAQDFINFLKKKEFFIAIATDSYQFLADALAVRLNIDMAYGNILEFNNGVITGRVLTPLRCLKIPDCKEFSICKLWFLRRLKSRINGITVCVGDGGSDICAFTEADISIAYRPRNDRLKNIAHEVVSDFDDATKVLKNELRKSSEILQC